MTDAEALFISWAQSSIKKDGLGQLPVWIALPPKISAQPTCVANRPALVSDVAAECKTYRTISWSVTGYSDVDAARQSNQIASKLFKIFSI